MDIQQVPSITCLDDLINQLRVVFQSDCVNVDYVRALLAAYKSNPKDWKQFAIFDPHRYVYVDFLKTVREREREFIRQTNIK